MQDMQQAIQVAASIIKQFEGFRANIYLCPANLSTIGYGHVVTANEKLESITLPQAEVLLYKDIATSIAIIARNIKVPLGIYQLAALISFTFNVGGGALERSTLRQKVNRQEHDLVPHELKRWVWGGGKILPGLIKRRQIESQLYAS